MNYVLAPVRSSNVESAGYDPAQSRMVVKFKSGGVYAYDQVPWSTYQAFLDSKSKGTFVRDVLVAQPRDYPCTKLEVGK